MSIGAGIAIAAIWIATAVAAFAASEVAVAMAVVGTMATIMIAMSSR